MRRFLMISSIVVGLLCAVYTVYLDYKIHEDSEYIAMCDVAEKVSCTAVITSEYSKLFSLMGLVPKDSVLDVPNANFGVVFYSLLLFLSLLSTYIPHAPTLTLIAAVASSVLSLVLLYIMIAILQDICVVCMLTHLCNAIVLIVAVLDFRDFKFLTDKSKKV